MSSSERTQHEKDRQSDQGAPGEIWWDGEELWYFAYLWQDEPGVTLMRTYCISSMPSRPNDVKKGNILASNGWRFVYTYFSRDFTWTIGQGTNGGKGELYWQKAFVHGIQRYRGVDPQTGRDYNVYDYNPRPQNWNGQPQVGYPTNAYGNLGPLNNRADMSHAAMMSRRWGFRLNTNFRMGEPGNRECLCVGQLWRRNRTRWGSEGSTFANAIPDSSPIVPIKYWWANNGWARPERREYEPFSEGLYIHGNNDSGKEVMIIDIRGLGMQNTDEVFYMSFGIGGWDRNQKLSYCLANEGNRQYAMFNDRRIYKSTVDNFYKLFRYVHRPDERPTMVAPPRAPRPPIRRQNAESEDVENANTLDERLGSDSWPKEWGHGPDFIKWLALQEEKHEGTTTDLTSDSSGSGPSSTGASDPNHSYQRAKRKASLAPLKPPPAPRPRIRRQPRGLDYYRMMVVLKNHVRIVGGDSSIRPRPDDVLRVIDITEREIPIPIQLGDVVVTKQSTAPWRDLNIDYNIFRRITVRQEWIPRGEWRYTVSPDDINGGYNTPYSMAIMSNEALIYVRQQQTLRSLRSHSSKPEIPESDGHRRSREREEEGDRLRNLYDIYEMFKPKIKF